MEDQLRKNEIEWEVAMKVLGKVVGGSIAEVAIINHLTRLDLQRNQILLQHAERKR